MTSSDPSAQLRREPMSSFQIAAVAICVALNALDGFDILAITFAGPGIAREWGLGPGGLGIVISTGLVGMSVGSLLLAPLADSLGRRPIILLCLILMTVGMLLSATAEDVIALSIWRIVTGLGIGGMLASINAMVAEYSNDARRDFCVSLMTIGYPLGGVLGGMASCLVAGRVRLALGLRLWRRGVDADPGRGVVAPAGVHRVPGVQTLTGRSGPRECDSSPHGASRTFRKCRLERGSRA